MDAMVCRVSISRASGRAHTDLIDFPRNYREFPYMWVCFSLHPCNRTAEARTAMPLPMRAQRPSGGTGDRARSGERGEGGGRDQDG